MMANSVSSLEKEISYKEKKYLQPLLGSQIVVRLYFLINDELDAILYLFFQRHHVNCKKPMAN